MNLKEIIKKGLIVGGLLVALNGFAEGNSPKVYADQLRCVQFREQKNLLHLGYDTDKDGREDVRIEYQAREYGGKLFDFYLKDYAVDLNKDEEYSEDEWFGNISYLTDFNMGKKIYWKLIQRDYHLLSSQNQTKLFFLNIKTMNPYLILF
jgi:hypothetical protein